MMTIPSHRRAGCLSLVGDAVYWGGAGTATGGCSRQDQSQSPDHFFRFRLNRIIRPVPSIFPGRERCPIGWENVTYAHFSVLLPTSHSLIVLSSPPDAKVLPSGLYDTDITALVCPLRVAMFVRLATFHSLIVLSQLPDAKVLPSGYTY